MKIFSVAASAGFILACFAALPAAAQQPGLAPHVVTHGVNPSLSLSAPTNSPLQDQMRQDYDTSLSGTQRGLLQQNPSAARSAHSC